MPSLKMRIILFKGKLVGYSKALQCYFNRILSTLNTLTRAGYFIFLNFKYDQNLLQGNGHKSPICPEDFEQVTV